MIINTNSHAIMRFNYQQPPAIDQSISPTLMKQSSPSSSSLKKYKVEIKLNEPLDQLSYGKKISHLYRAGDLINGDLILTPPCSKNNDVQFNEISITLECKLMNNTVGGPNGTKILFRMDDSPQINSSILLTSTTSFPFNFKLPERLLDTTCSKNVELHKSLPPSFGSPKICGMVFSADKNAGSVPFECEQYATYKDLMFQRFCVVYYITATISQRISENGKPFVIFKRVLDIPVQNNHEVVPTNLTKSPYDIASYYDINEVTHDNDLILIKSTGLKKDCISFGFLTASTLVPSPISLSSSSFNMNIPISLKFKPSIAPITLPKLKFTAHIIEYVVQSSSCLPPTAKPLSLPNDYKVERGGNIRKITQKIRSIPCSIGLQNIDDNDLWIPDYDNENILLKQVMIQIPHLIAHKLQPTFHTCTLQNTYILQLKVLHDDYETPQPMRKGSSGSLFERMGFAPKSSGGNEASEIMRLDLPLTLLS